MPKYLFALMKELFLNVSCFYPFKQVRMCFIHPTANFGSKVICYLRVYILAILFILDSFVNRYCIAEGIVGLSIFKMNPSSSEYWCM